MSRHSSRPTTRFGLDLGAAAGGTLATRGAVSVVGLAAQGVVRLAVTVAVGRIGGTETLGVVAAGLATAQFLILLWPTTSGQAASRFVARARGRDDPAELRAVAGHLARRAVLASAGLAAVAAVVSAARGFGTGGGLCVGALLLGLAGQQFTRGLHYGMGAVRRVVTLDITLSVLGLAGVVAALLAGARGPTLLLPLAAAYLVLTVLCRPVGATGAPTRELARELDRFVAFGSLGTIASAGLVQLSVLVAGHLGAAATGQYAAASNLAIPLTLLSGALSLVLYPSMSQAVGRGDAAAVARQLDSGVRGVLFLVVPAVLTGVLLAEPVTTLVYGPGFVGAASTLAVLVVAVLTSMVAVPCVNALTSADERGIVEMSAASLAGLLVAAVVWVVTAPTGDVRHVAIGYACGVGVTATYAVARTARRWRTRWARPLLAAAVVLAAAAVGRQLWADPGPRTLLLLVLVAAWAGLLGPERRLVLELARGARRG